MLKLLDFCFFDLDFLFMVQVAGACLRRDDK